jgi:ribosomal protein S27AE
MVAIGKKRRTWHAISTSMIMRNKKECNRNCVEGSFRIEHFLDFMRNFLEAMAKANVRLVQRD